ncbi:MAG: Bcr/CflA family drug resistance efflux transporter [Moraxellaceae bacterium]|nr:MAG: Bcr/CflA family drug resistance efflux transporter [Moraxellaceae bacterium]
MTQTQPEQNSSPDSSPNSQPQPKTSHTEFIWLMALLMSLIALAIDAMLPAFDQIGSDLGVSNANDIQLIIATVFFGMAMGLMIYGPLSDAYGRKRVIYLGISIFLIGTLISGLATDFNLLLVGRIIQGFGAAACRVVTMAMIRDKFSGREMGRIMSLVMVIFMLVPALAPALGQVILLFADWRAIFWFMFVLGVACFVWMALRQPETLDEAKRIPFSIANVTSGILETWRHPQSRGYTIAAGLVFGAFVGYLSSAQQILQVQYQVGDMFAVYFGLLALSIGLSSYSNSRLVMKYSMETLCMASLIAITILSSLFYAYAHSVAGHPPLGLLITYLATTFFCFGLLFGNYGALAVQPLGHIAGVATSVISSIQTFISVIVGGFVGYMYDGTVEPLVLGFLVCSVVTVIFTFRLGKKHTVS